MYPERHALRFGVYAGALYALSTRGAIRKLIALGAAAAYVGGPLRRARARLRDPDERTRAFAAIPALMAFIDAAKMAGWLAGASRRRDGR
jgi:hypothetical protein